MVIQDRANIWNFPGGKLELGEMPFECAIREVEEGIGLRVHNLKEVYHGEFWFDNTYCMILTMNMLVFI